MIRYSVVKMGDRLKEISDVGGTAEWGVSRYQGDVRL